MCLRQFLQTYVPEAVKIKYDLETLFPEESNISVVNLKEILRL